MLQEFTQEVENTARDVVDEIHTALPGRIISFNPSACTASVKPIGRYVTSDGKELDYPVITEAPVIFPFCQTEDVGIAFPVKSGDNCIIIVSEVELDSWRSGAESEGTLRFDLTSAIIIPGLINSGYSIVEKAASLNSVVIKNKEVEVIIGNNAVEVNGRLQVSGNGASFNLTDNNMNISIDGVSAKIGNGQAEISIGSTNFKVHESGATIVGDLKIEGNILYTDTCQKFIEND